MERKLDDTVVVNDGMGLTLLWWWIENDAFFIEEPGQQVIVAIQAEGSKNFIGCGITKNNSSGRIVRNNNPIIKFVENYGKTPSI